MITEILLTIIIILIFITLISALMLAFKARKILHSILPPSFLDSNPDVMAGVSTNDVSLHLTSSWKYKLMKLKAYFENGYSVLSYPKWVVAVLGVGEVVNKNYTIVFIGALLFALICVVIGYIFINFGFYEAQQEVSNQFNLFVKEVRERKSI